MASKGLTQSSGSTCASSHSSETGRMLNVLPRHRPVCSTPRGSSSARTPASHLMGHTSAHARQHSRHRTRDVASSGVGLATYNLRTHSNSSSSKASASTNWLASSMPHIVSQLSHHQTKPFLELIFSHPRPHSRTMLLPAQASHAPEYWQSLASQVRTSGADGLVLVRPIASPNDYCPLRSSMDLDDLPATSTSNTSPNTAGSKTSSSNATGGQQQQQQAVSCVPCGDPHNVLSSIDGTAGEECCGGHGPEEAGHTAAATTALVSSSRYSSSSGGDETALHQHSSSTGAAGGGSSSVSYYGLVVQSARRDVGAGEGAEVDGCYVLKTSRNLDGLGCSCVHYTLTHVCKGQPLEAQLQHSWLV